MAHKRKKHWTSPRRVKKRRVRFTPKPAVIGTADAAVDRVSTPVQLFDCDVCGSRIHAGLKGFELYARCVSCDFDACLACCKLDNGVPKCERHADHAFVLVDRNKDDDVPPSSSESPTQEN